MANVLEQIRSRRLAFTPWQSQSALLAIGALFWLALMALFGAGELLGWAVAHFFNLLIIIGGVALLTLLPGLALLRLCWNGPLGWPERLALAWACGLALPPLLLSAVHVIGLPWPGWMAFVYLAAALAVLLFRKPAAAGAHTSSATLVPAYQAFLLAGLTLVVLLARLYTARDLLAGANVDSFHHTLIATLLVERQGLFSSWEPYAPLTTFTYHYGFHALVAFFHELTRIPVPVALPNVGQVMSAATVPLLYLLTFRLSGSRTAGIWAAVLVGFANTQPAYYVFWGRFPFVTSHLLLIGVIVCWMQVIEAKPGRLPRGPMVLAALTSAALAHTHYQATILAAIFLTAYLLIVLVRVPDLRSVQAIVVRSALIGGVALLLAAPWLVNTLSGNLDRNVVYTSELRSGETFPGVPIPPLTPFFIKNWMILLALGGTLLALRLRMWRVLLLALWALLNIFAALPYLVGLPGTGMIEAPVAPMTLYLTVIPLAGFALGKAQETYIQLWSIPGRERVVLRSLFGYAAPALVIMLLCVWGIGWQRDLVPPYARMVTAADERAYRWIQEHTAADARFVVNSHPIYGGLQLVGTDGGWWLPLLAGRQVNMPPMSYGSELPENPEYAVIVHQMAAELRQKKLTDDRPRSVDLTRPEAISLLRSAGYRYVYSGAQPLQGSGTFPAVDRIDTALLRQSPDFRLVYADGGVEIFELLY